MVNAALRLYLVRHGETPWSLSGQHTGTTDIGLTENGRLQAVAVGELIGKVKFAAIFCSPLPRAQLTAKLAGLQDATICDELHELDYGKYEGLTTAQIRAQVPGWTVWSHPCPGGETLAHARQRAEQVIKLAAGVGGDVCLIGHGHMLRVLVTTWLQVPVEQGRNFMLDACSVSVLSHEHEAPAVKLWNFTSASILGT